MSKFINIGQNLPKARSQISHKKILNPRPLFSHPALTLFRSLTQLSYSQLSIHFSPSLGFSLFVRLIIISNPKVRVVLLRFEFSMATETLEEKKLEGEPAEEVENKDEGKEEENKDKEKVEEAKEEEEEKKEEESEKFDRNNEVAKETEEPEVKEDEVKDKEEQEGTKKGKRSRKASVKKASEEPDESKKPSQESAESKKEKEPVTPSSERPTRERKVVERYSAPSAGRSATKPVSIDKGRGTQIKNIPNVAFKLSRRKPDDNLQMLHTILFGKKAKAHTLKKNIGQFSGYVWSDNEEKQRAKVKEKLDKCVKEKLVDFCDVLNIPINKAIVKKEELSVKLLEFLECPHATTDILLADKEQKGKKRKVTPSKNFSQSEASDVQAKKRKQTPLLGEKRKQSSRAEEEEEDDDKMESPDTKDDSDEDNDNDTAPKEESDHEDSESEEEEDEPKGKKRTQKSSSRKIAKDSSGAKDKDKSTPDKKGTSTKPVKNPVKSTKKSSSSTPRKGATDADGNSGSLSKPKGSTSKKQKVEKESAKETGVLAKEKGSGKKQLSKSPAKVSTKDQGKGKIGKKAKAEPTREEMHAVVVDILKEVDFNTATLSDILRQLGSHFGLDLMHRKAEVKDIITDVINNMSDEEDEGEEDDENAEAGGDADKDGDDDA